MEEKPRFPRPLEAFLVIIAGFIFIVLLTQLFLWIFVSQPEELEETSTTFKVLITLGELGLIVIPLIYIKNLNLSLKETFRWNGIPSVIVLWSVIIGFSISVLGDEMDRLVGMIIPAPEFLAEISAAMRINSTQDLLILVAGAVFAAAFIEESIIRGFLQKSLEKYQDVTRAVIYASLAWTIIHGMLYWAIQIFLLGIILGLLAWRSNSIFPSVIGHAINNTLALIFNNIQQENLEGVYLWGDHVSPLFLLLAVAGLFWGVKYFYQYYGNKPQNPYSLN
ncbi:MAG: CPBP family intramembrane metalloprotease [bacterium]|nr:MAG: CPBP family intramembrane metalloprotease [bacterium]